MSVLIKHMAMPKGCIYANDKDQTDYCPMLNHDDVPFCQYIENEPEIAIGIDERPVYCPLSDVPDTNAGDLISRQAAIARAVPLNLFGREVMIVSVSELENLPSAQPEIIRCKDCKHWTQSTGKMTGYGLGRCDFHDADLVACNGFCYWAERRTDEAD